MKDQVSEQLNKIRVAATAAGNDEEIIENWKVRDCVQVRFVTSVCLPSVFGPFRYSL